jgi:Fe-S cluster assembly protein SufD
MDLRTSNAVHKKLTQPGDCEDDLYTALLSKSEQLGGDIIYEHISPDTKSSILIKVAMRENSTLNLRALVKIHAGAKNAETRLDIKILIAGEGATVNCTPSVEVEENKVLGAGHGLTVSSFDRESLFYLQSRGIDLESAKDVLIKSFVNGDSQ